jgi:DNA-binding transcriptional LysR family regulator
MARFQVDVVQPRRSEVLGGVLFERKQSGLRLTPFGQRVATAAARVESEIFSAAYCLAYQIAGRRCCAASR